MINIDFEQIEILSEYFDVQTFIENDDIDGLLLKLDDVITEIGFDKNYELNDVGLKLQLLYDKIFNQN